MNSYLNKIRKQ